MQQVGRQAVVLIGQQVRLEHLRIGAAAAQSAFGAAWLRVHAVAAKQGVAENSTQHAAGIAVQDQRPGTVQRAVETVNP